MDLPNWIRFRNFLDLNQAAVIDVTVTLADGTEFTGQVLSLDTEAECVVLKRAASEDGDEATFDAQSIVKASVNVQDGTQSSY
ncbi:MAG TPA: hypothetical protein VHM70_05855 [Polyangiaceae bacterium]|jgi:hypothetical protein|nr:hypothetical protein [Polyangiaceae bacterium]